MSFAINHPFFDQPVIDYLQPVTSWTEIPDTIAEIDVALIVVQYQPGAGSRVVRAEVTRSPAYVKMEYGRMFAPGVITEMALGGHKVTIDRFVVQGSIFDCMPDLDLDEPPAEPE